MVDGLQGALLRAAAAEITVVALILLGLAAFTAARGGSWRQALATVGDRVRQNPILIGVWGIFLGTLLRIGGVEASYFRYLVIAIVSIVLGLGPVVFIIALTMRRFKGEIDPQSTELPKDAKRYLAILTVIVCVGLGLLLYALGFRTS